MRWLLIEGWILPSAHMQLSSHCLPQRPPFNVSEIHQWSKFFFCPCPPPTLTPLSSPEWCHSASDHRRSEGVSKASDGSLSLQINRASPLTLSQSLSFAASHFHSIILSFVPISSQMLWNRLDFPPHLSYLFRRLPNTSFSKWHSNRKTVNSLLEKFITAETSKWKSFWVRVGAEAKSHESRNVRSLTWLFLTVRKHPFLSSPPTPGGLGVLPSLTCLCLQWHVFISFTIFGQIHSCYFHFWWEVYILEVMQKHPGSENLWPITITPPPEGLLLKISVSNNLLLKLKIASLKTFNLLLGAEIDAMTCKQG